MTRYLLFTLYGPMASWGRIAVGSLRQTEAHPSKSAVLGLIAAALGIRHDDDEPHRALEASLRFAVHVRRAGTLLRDYHTIQVPRSRRKVRHATRKQEIEFSASDLNTILSARDHRTDHLSVVAVWQTGRDAEHSLDDIAIALGTPRFTPYLGRKACPPALPFDPRLIEAPSLADAFQGYPRTYVDFLGTDLEPGRLYWESDGAHDDNVGVAWHEQHRRRDRVHSRTERQFEERIERVADLPVLSEAD